MSTEPNKRKRPDKIARRGGEDIWKNYDPQNVKEALAKFAGSWSDLDIDEMIAHIYRAREEGSRPAHRP